MKSYQSLIILSTAVILMALTIASCSDLPALKGDDKIFARQLDDIDKTIQEYGIATMSAPIFVKADSETFKFNLDRAETEYFEEAKDGRQASVDLNELTSTVIQAAISKEKNIDLIKKQKEDEDYYYDKKQQYLAQKKITDQVQQDMVNNARDEYIRSVTDAQLESDKAKRDTLIDDADSRYKSRLSNLSLNEPSFPAQATSSKSSSASGVEKLDTKLPFEENFTDYLSLRPQKAKNTISNREAITVAAGDKTTQDIFKVLGNPSGVNSASTNEVVWGVSMVSIIPGRITRKNFAAELRVKASIELKEVDDNQLKKILDKITSRNSFKEIDSQDQILLKMTENYISSKNIKIFDKKIKEILEKNKSVDKEQEYNDLPQDFKGGIIEDGKDGFYICEDHERCRFKLLSDTGEDIAVAAVSPMTQSQTIDLNSSIRDQKIFSLSVAAALNSTGNNSSGNLFSEYAKRLEKDSSSATQQNLVTGYSRGSLFGYQVGPSFQALERPDKNSSDAGYILQRQTFPILVMFEISNIYKNPKFYLIKKKDSDQSEIALLGSNINLQQDYSWTPIRRFAAWFWRPTVTDSARAMSAIATMTSEISSYKASSYVARKVAAVKEIVGQSKISLPISLENGLIPKIERSFPVVLKALNDKESVSVLYVGSELGAVDGKTCKVEIPKSGVVISSINNIASGLETSLTLTKEISDTSIVISCITSDKKYRVLSSAIDVLPKEKVDKIVGIESTKVTPTIKITTVNTSTGSEKQIILDSTENDKIRNAVDILKIDSESKKPIIIPKETQELKN